MNMNNIDIFDLGYELNSNEQNSAYYERIKYQDRRLYNCVDDVARIDIKFCGEDDMSANIQSVENANIYMPVHLQENGVGYVTETTQNEFFIDLYTTNVTQIDILLRGRYAVNKRNEPEQYFVNYTYFTINNEVKFNENIIVWHNTPIICQIMPKDGEKYVSEFNTLKIKWQPYDNNLLKG